MEDEKFEKEQERIQRALNEAKKKEISEKFGAQFGQGEAKIPPEIESQWLNNIEQFELQYENAKRVTVREYVGNPVFKPQDQIAPEQLGAELDRVLEFLESHNVGVDFLCDVPDDVAYEFVTKELMDHEMDDLHLPGWTTRFIYEEFHPNDEYDAKRFADHFLWELFERQEEYAVSGFAEDEVYDQKGTRITREKMKEMILALYANYAAFTSHEFECSNCTVEGDYATVTFHGTWTGLKAVSMESVSYDGESELRMKKSPYGGFDVVEANIQGWEY